MHGAGELISLATIWVRQTARSRTSTCHTEYSALERVFWHTVPDTCVLGYSQSNNSDFLRGYDYRDCQFGILTYACLDVCMPCRSVCALCEGVKGRYLTERFGWDSFLHSQHSAIKVDFLVAKLQLCHGDDILSRVRPKKRSALSYQGYRISDDLIDHATILCGAIVAMD